MQSVNNITTSHNLTSDFIIAIKYYSELQFRLICHVTSLSDVLSAADKSMFVA